MRVIYIFLFSTLLFGNSYEVKLYETLFTKLFKKSDINIFVDENKEDFKNSEILNVVDKCNKADIILLYSLKKMKCNKPIFVTSYIDFINTEAIGAFYWRKGRPQIILNKRMLKKYHLFLDKSLLKYAK